MFTTEVARQHGVLVVRFSGSFGREDLVALDAIASVLVKIEGPLCGLFDFTDVTTVTISTSALAERARRPQMCPGHKRVIVAPQPEMFGLGRVFGAYQSSVGSEAPLVVKTMAEALDYLGFETLKLEPVAVGALSTALIS